MTREILPSLPLGRTLALALPISFIPYCSPGGRHVWEATLDALSATVYAVHLLFRSTKRRIEAGGHYSFQSCVRHPQTASACTLTQCRSTPCSRGRNANTGWREGRNLLHSPTGQRSEFREQNHNDFSNWSSPPKSRTAVNLKEAER